MMNAIPVVGPMGMMQSAPRPYQYQQAQMQLQQMQSQMQMQPQMQQGRMGGAALDNAIAQMVIQCLIQMIQQKQASMNIQPTSLEMLLARLGGPLVPRQQYNEVPKVTPLVSQGLGLPVSGQPVVYDPMNSMWRC